MLCLYLLANSRGYLWRWLWLLPLGGFGYALLLTYSRGGFLSLLAALFVLVQQRWGGFKSLLLGTLGILALFLGLAGGRQTDLSVRDGTGQQRVQLWSDGFVAARSSPLFGIGVDRYDQFTGGLGAHNSFVHSYVEMGFLGGTLFLGAFWFAMTALHRLGAPRLGLADRHLRGIRPFLLAVLIGYGASMLVSSRCYEIPTYLLLGLATVHLRLVRRYVEVPGYRLTPRLVLRLLGISLLTVILLQCFILVAVNWSGP